MNDCLMKLFSNSKLRLYCCFASLLKTNGMKQLSILVLLFSLVLLSCRRSSDPVNQRQGNACGEAVQVNAGQYQNKPSEKVFIRSASIQDDCLTINFSASGCGTDSWQPRLFDAGAIAKSLPPQRSIRMTLITNQLCQAVLGKTVQFDIFPLRVEGMKKVMLNLEGYDQSLTYAY
jgi:hypothetical protein